MGATSTSITLSNYRYMFDCFTKISWYCCTLSSGNKVLHKVIINKYNKYKELNERDQQTIKPFDKLYRKKLQDNVIDKTEYESLCNVFTNYADEIKNEFFLGI